MTTRNAGLSIRYVGKRRMVLRIASELHRSWWRGRGRGKAIDDVGSKAKLKGKAGRERGTESEGQREREMKVA